MSSTASQIESSSLKMATVNSQDRWIEIVYLLMDILPIIITFFVGAVLLAVLCVAEISMVISHKLKQDPSRFRKWVRGKTNILILFMYGGSSGLLQESKTRSECHENSRFCKLYIGNKEVPDNAVLYFFLTAKSIVMIAFIISVFCDLFFVVSFGDCDEKHDCYFVDTNYYNPPIENCSGVLDNQTVCYAFNLGFVEAAGAAGGLIAFSRLLFIYLMVWCEHVCCFFSGPPF